MAPSGCCNGPGNPLSHAATLLVGGINLGRKILGMKPWNVEGTGNQTSEEDTITVISSIGTDDPSQDTTDAPTTIVDGDDFIDVGNTVVKTKNPFKSKGDKGQGTLKGEGNAAKDFMKGVKDAKKKQKKAEVGGQVISTLGSGEGEVETDTTVTATFADGIEDFNPEQKGGMFLLKRKDSTGKMKKSQVKSFRNAAQGSIKKQEEKVKTMNHEDIDINNGN
jgi:hypothetical protein